MEPYLKWKKVASGLNLFFGRPLQRRSRAVVRKLNLMMKAWGQFEEGLERNRLYHGDGLEVVNKMEIGWEKRSWVTGKKNREKKRRSSGDQKERMQLSKGLGVNCMSIIGT